jgi:hypothetical protein
VPSKISLAPAGLLEDVSINIALVSVAAVPAVFDNGISSYSTPFQG